MIPFPTFAGTFPLFANGPRGFRRSGVPRTLLRSWAGVEARVGNRGLVVGVVVVVVVIDAIDDVAGVAGFASSLGSLDGGGVMAVEVVEGETPWSFEGEVEDSSVLSVNSHSRFFWGAVVVGVLAGSLSSSILFSSCNRV